ncbi:MAG: hypothetical protein CMN78_00570 [Spirochaetales bacterium]|nr:hypothetical protein [Spirochaetales bacterium]
MGMKHSGKSTLSRMLAWHMKGKYRDLDTLVEAEYRSDRTLTCREIYRQHGREFFQGLEQLAAERLAEDLSRGNVAAALGGGTIDNERALRPLSGLGVFVYLQETADVLYERIAKGGVPAFLDNENPYEDFILLYNRRTPRYEELSEIIVRLDGGGTEASFALLIKTLEENHYVW